MKGDKLLSFPGARPKDLSSFEDSWIGETISERDSRVLAEIRAFHIKELGLETEDEIKELEGKSPFALLPSHNMRYIREIIFPVSDNVTQSDLKEVLPGIRERFVIDGFQTAIDHQRHMAHIVCDWYDRRNGTCVYLYPNKRDRLSVFLVRELDLPRPAGYELWLRHFLLEDFKEDEHVFQTWADHLKYARLGRKGYNVVCNALQFAELVCKRIVK